MKLLVKDRVHPVGDIIFRCFALAFNCRPEPWQEWLHGQRERHSERALVTRGSQQEVCPGTRSPEEFGREVPSTHP